MKWNLGIAKQNTTHPTKKKMLPKFYPGATEFGYYYLGTEGLAPLKGKGGGFDFIPILLATIRVWPLATGTKEFHPSLPPPLLQEGARRGGGKVRCSDLLELHGSQQENGAQSHG